MKIDPNCQLCFYGGVYNHNKQLASCECEKVRTITEYDPFFKKDRQWVPRQKWDEECDCGYFIPRLSEANGDYELEAVVTFNTSFECPFCGETVYVWNIGFEEIAFITCDECDRQIVVTGKTM